MSGPASHRGCMKAGKTKWLEQGGNIAFAVTVVVSVAPLLCSMSVGD